MSSLEREAKEYKKMLDEGKIDQKTYNIEINRLLRKTNDKKSYNKMIFLDLLHHVKKILIVFLMICAILFLYNNSHVEKDFEIVESLSDLPDPIQESTTGEVELKMFGEDVKIEYVASYSISGRVIDVQSYFGFNSKNKFSPRDIGLTWGFLSTEENSSKLAWTSVGDRYLSYYVQDKDWLESVGGDDALISHFSNNHLIPSNDITKKLMKAIKKGDYVKIDGYLANVDYDGKKERWETSTTRTDEGSKGNEIIYVTNIKWLTKE